MADLTMMLLLAIAVSLASGWAFHSAVVGFQVANTVLLMYMVYHHWAKHQAAGRILKILTGEDTDNPEMKPVVGWVKDVLDVKM